MNKLFATTLAIFGTALAISVAAVPAHAQATRTWVSGVGDDANPCSRTAPCKTFAGAISKTAINGEINCLDPGGFGAVTITKSITLDCHEVFGSILVAGTNAINVPFDSLADAAKTVNIRNLNFDGFAQGLTAINVTGAAANTQLNIEDVMIDGFKGGAATGINDSRTNGSLTITNTTVRDNGGTGISLGGGSGLLRATLNRVKMTNSVSGLSLKAGAAVHVGNSEISSNLTNGVLMASGSQLNLDSSIISHNGTGINNSAGGTVRISNNDFSFNSGAGLSGTILTYSNNRFSNNGGGGTLSPIGGPSNPTGQQ